MFPQHRNAGICAAMAVAVVLACAVEVWAQDPIAQAADQYVDAQRAHEALLSRAPSRRTRADYLRVLHEYERTYLITPHTGYADDALLNVALLYEEIGEVVFAERTWNFLISDYPASRFVDRARDEVARLEAMKDDVRAIRAVSKPPVVANPEAADNPGSSDEPAVPTSVDPTDIAVVGGVRFWESDRSVRVVVDLDRGATFRIGDAFEPPRVFIDLAASRVGREVTGRTLEVGTPSLKSIRIGQFDPTTVRVVLDLTRRDLVDAFMLTNPYRLVVDVRAPEDVPVPEEDGLDFRNDTTLRTSETNPEDAPAPAEAATTSGIEAAASPTPADATTAAAETPVVAEAERPAVNDLSEYNAVSETSAVDAAAAPVEMAAVDAPTPVDPAVDAPPNAPVPGPLPTELVVVVEELPAVAFRTAETLEAVPVVESTAVEAVADPVVVAETALVDSTAESTADELVTTPASPTLDGDHSLIRSLGLKIGRVVIDPGHGGHDTGTIGPSGLREKDVVLDLAQRLKERIEAELHAEVVMTRTDDTFVGLEDRTAIANDAQADLFLSIHVNSSSSGSVRGFETYVLNIAGTNAEREIAARENAASQASISQLQDLVSKIMFQDKAEESREFAARVQQALARAGDFGRDRGVKQAPFVVLIGAEMPSILAEVSFISNPDDEQRLRDEQGRGEIVDALFEGVRSYAETLSGFRTASVQP